MNEHFYAVIMAGGGGTRLWPLSRKDRPKQMLSLFDERSLFQTSVERLKGVFDCKRIFVVTVAEQAEKLQEQTPDIPAENFLIEPMPRGTASVVGMAAIALRQRDPQAVMAVLTSDHYIGNEENFRETLRTAYEIAEDGYLVTLGITPTFPATGYGYIQRGSELKEYRGRKVYEVRRFKEKPDEAQAREMLAGGDHSWNSGMFAWKVDTILGEMERQMPDLYHDLEEIEKAWNTSDRKAVIQRIWPTLREETIDYGIMEGARKVAVIPSADLGWSDVGSWDSLFEVLESDENGNIVIGGDHISLESKNSLVYAHNARRLIVTIGISDLVVVDTGDVLLVCPKEKAQMVRQVVNQLKKKNESYV